MPYIIFQFPANIVIRKLGAAKWLGSLVTTWGGVTVGMGFLTDWTQLLGTRIILGVLEASPMLCDLPDQIADKGSGRLLSRLRVSALMLVRALRGAETIQRLLLACTSCSRLLEHPCLWSLRDERSRWTERLAVDLCNRKTPSRTSATF